MVHPKTEPRAPSPELTSKHHVSRRAPGLRAVRPGGPIHGAPRTRQAGDDPPEGTRAGRARVFRQDMDVLSKNPAPACEPGGQEPGRRVRGVAFSLPTFLLATQEKVGRAARRAERNASRRHQVIEKNPEFLRRPQSLPHRQRQSVAHPMLGPNRADSLVRQACVHHGLYTFLLGPVGKGLVWQLRHPRVCSGVSGAALFTAVPRARGESACVCS